MGKSVSHLLFWSIWIYGALIPICTDRCFFFMYHSDLIDVQRDRVCKVQIPEPGLVMRSFIVLHLPAS
jgi:hypothetical protein